MTYTTEQKQIINNIAGKFCTSEDRVERMFNSYFESDKYNSSFDDAVTDIIEGLHDHQQDMEMDAWEGSDEYEGEDYE